MEDVPISTKKMIPVWLMAQLDIVIYFVAIAISFIYTHTSCKEHAHEVRNYVRQNLYALKRRESQYIALYAAPYEDTSDDSSRCRKSSSSSSEESDGDDETEEVRGGQHPLLPVHEDDSSSTSSSEEDEPRMIPLFKNDQYRNVTAASHLPRPLMIRAPNTVFRI